MHAHFDCFSGAAGDMLLAALIDAAQDRTDFLDKLRFHLKEGLQEISSEWDISTHRVLRGSGMISANKVDVKSIYQHRSAPPPSAAAECNNHHGMSQSHEHAHYHDSRYVEVQGYMHHHHHDHDHDGEGDFGPEKVISPESVAHLPIPEWKKKPLETSSDVDCAPFGSDSGIEVNLAAACAEDKNASVIYSHHHSTPPTSDSHQYNHKQLNTSDNHSHEHAHSREEHSHQYDHKQLTASDNHSHEHAHSREEYSQQHDRKQFIVSDNHSHEHVHLERSHSYLSSTRTVPHGHSHGHGHNGPLRNVGEITRLINAASDKHLPLSVKRLAIDAFLVLAKAEALTHGTNIENVHFHEVGAIDSIVDTVGVVLALNMHGVKTVSCSRLPLGEGTVMTDHGLLPVPAPATLRLLCNMPVCPGPPGYTGELVTPTAAALLKTLSQERSPKQAIDGRPPAMTLRAVGIGAGTKEFGSHPNIVRVMLGDSDENVKVVREVSENENSSKVTCNTNSLKAKVGEEDVDFGAEMNVFGALDSERHKLVHLEANIDDCTPEIIAFTTEKLLQAGSIDVWQYPIFMKKGRLAHCLNCLFKCDENGVMERKLLYIIFKHSTTFGVRIHRGIDRVALRRKFVPVEISEGGVEQVVNVKVGMMGKDNDVVTASAEFEDCKALANECGTSISEISTLAVTKAREIMQRKKDDVNEVPLTTQG